MAAEIDDLKNILKNGRALIICGAGVSAALTGGKAPGWKALIEACVAYGVKKGLLNTIDEEDCRRWLAAGTVTEQWLYAAERVRSKLGSGFRVCLAEALEKLVCTNADLMNTLKSLRDSGNAIATTNYDDLLAFGLGVRAVTWLQPVDAMKIVKGITVNVFHIHGQWAEADSVVFSNADYKRVTEPETSQFVQKLAIHNRTLVFLGCSLDGLSDANMGALLEWFQTSWEGLGERHYVLCLDKDQVGWPDAVTPIVYGAAYGDLTGFLRDLAPTPVVAEARLEVDPQMIGRGDVKQRILDWVQADNWPVIISGGPGMGKSAMALAVAYDPAVKARFGEERYFLRLDAAGDAHAMVTAAATKLGLRVQNAKAEVVADQIAGAIVRPTLLILDNLESPWDKNRPEVESVIARLAACEHLYLLLTIRGPLLNLSCDSYRIDDIEELNEADSLMLFHRATGHLFVNDPDLPELMRLMAGHPLCITLMAAQTDGVSLKDVLARWEKQRAKMVRKDGADNRLNNLEISVGLSFERLSGLGKRLARLVARLPAGFAMWMAREILGDAADEAALELVRARLMKVTDERLLMLAPLREALLLQAVQDKEDEWALMFRMMSIAAKGENVLQNMSAEEIAEIENLDATLIWAMHEGVTEGLGDAQFGLATLHRISARGSVASVVQGVEYWRRLGDKLQEANCRHSLGVISLDISDYEEARKQFEQALALFRARKGLRGEAHCTRSLAVLALRLFRDKEASKQFELARTLYQNAGDVAGEASCLIGLGDIALGRSEDVDARTQFGLALRLFRKEKVVQGKAQCIRWLGVIALRGKNPLAARAKFKLARVLFRKAGDVLGQANCLIGLGDVLEKTQGAAAAKPQWIEALAQYTGVPHPDPFSIGNCHHRLAAATAGDERHHHLSEARRLWLSVGRADLVAKNLDKG
jgi:tetratricopeptide (TPR) repeat protein